MSTRVLLVDDHPIFLKGLKVLLEEEKHISVVGEAGDGKMAIELVRELSPHVVIMDIAMPEMNGDEVTRQIVKEFPHIKVIAHSIHSGKNFVSDMLCAGAVGYILKESAPEEILEAINAVMRGEMFLGSSITGIVLSQFVKSISGDHPNEKQVELKSKETLLLRTKLHPPPITPDFVPRLNLRKDFERVSKLPITLVSAGAGYGKSTLASTWIDSSHCPAGWLSLDEGDNDLHLFFTYFLAALETILPKNSGKSELLLNAPIMPPLSLITRTLINDLAKVNEPFILVLDDYHKIHNKEIHDFLSEILFYPPPSMHLLLLTRQDPPLPLSRLRAMGQLGEISIDQLRFSKEETSRFLKNVLELEPDEKTVAIIEEKIEGWPTGLRLMTHSMSKSKSLKNLLNHLNGDFISVINYLVNEVTMAQDRSISELMLRTSILDRFCVPLCDILFEQDRKEEFDKPDGADFICSLQKNNLFIISLDYENKWFRYHHLFQNLLKNQLKLYYSKEKIVELHKLVSKWFEEQGIIEDAIDHALAAGDINCAAQIVEKNRYKIVNLDQWHTLNNWLERLPPEIIQKRAGLLLCKAWILYFQFRIVDICPILEKIESLLNNKQMGQEFRREYYFFVGNIRYWGGDGKGSLKYFLESQELLEKECNLIKGEVELYIGFATYMAGQRDKAIAGLKKSITDMWGKDNYYLIRLVAGISFISMLNGHLAESSEMAVIFGVLAQEIKSKYSEGWAYYLQGRASYNSYHLQRALEYFRLAVENKYILHRKVAIESLAGMAITYLLMKLPDKARETVREMILFTRETGDAKSISVALSFQARISLLEGDLASAVKWLQSFNETVNVPEMFLFLECSVVTQCRVLVAIGTEDSLEKALEILQPLWKECKNIGLICHMIDIGILITLVMDKQGHLSKALEKLEQVLDLSSPGGWISSFIEAGSLLEQLLKKLVRKNKYKEFIKKILNVHPSSDCEPVLTEPDGSTESRSFPTSEFLVENLTNREFEILELLGKRLTNNEIARELFISQETVYFDFLLSTVTSI